jgi:hypothetical protein
VWRRTGSSRSWPTTSDRFLTRASSSAPSWSPAGRIPHAWIFHTDTSTIDLVDRGVTLFTVAGREWTRAGAAVDVGVPVTVRELDLVTARAMGVFADGALLVRPDGAPVGYWRTAHDARRRIEQVAREVTGELGGRPSARDTA